MNKVFLHLFPYKFSQVFCIIYEIISVFAAIGWISIIANIIIDFISFIAFYFNLNEIILSALLLSAGNTVGDFFGNAAFGYGRFFDL